MLFLACYWVVPPVPGLFLGCSWVVLGLFRGVPSFSNDNEKVKE